MAKIKKNNKGYTLVEIIFYISLFAILSIAVINALVTMTKAFKETSIQADLTQGGKILEKISREVRQASSLSSISSSSLKLNTTDASGVNKTVEFSLSGPNVRYLENDSFIDNLNSDNLSVLDLSFTQINTTNSKAIKIFLNVRSNNDPLGRNENFYDTVVLRGSY